LTPQEVVSVAPGRPDPSNRPAPDQPALGSGGTPVIFCHPWGLNADIWEYQAIELSKQGLRCIEYDRRGHGRSDDPGRGYDYDTLAGDLAALIEQRDLRNVTLVGYSTNAWTAQLSAGCESVRRVRRMLARERTWSALR
jgi:pimeloyl-ACP methyl ester carboxylesterase